MMDLRLYYDILLLESVIRAIYASIIHYFLALHCRYPLNSVPVHRDRDTLHVSILLVILTLIYSLSYPIPYLHIVMVQHNMQ